MVVHACNPVFVGLAEAGGLLQMLVWATECEPVLKMQTKTSKLIFYLQK